MFLLVLLWELEVPSITNLSKYNHHSLRKRLSILIIRLRLNKKVSKKKFYIFFIYNSCFHESSSLFQQELRVVGQKYFTLDDYIWKEANLTFISMSRGPQWTEQLNNK